ncbi:MAG: hypothetical protein PHV33_05320 [Elusimicrobiales bacterium]|nr:hypothetical protein [Elusimicrobiales bacterium]
MSPKPLPTCLALCLALLPPLGAQEPEASTAAPARVQSPLMLTISKDSYRSRVGLDYAIRWDFSDLASVRPSLGFLYSGIKAVSNWDITENTRVEYYGFKTNPWRLIIAKEKKNGSAAAAAGPGAGADSAVVTRATPEYRKRLRLSVSPLVDDLKRNFDDGLRDFLLRSSLKDASPEWEKMGDANRKIFVKDVLSLGIWNSGLPVLKQAGEGLEYISGEKNGAAPKK